MPLIIDGYIPVDVRKAEAHLGHHLTVATYGKADEPAANLAIECMDCYEVVGDIDLNRPKSLPCGCDTQAEHDEGVALQRETRRKLRIPKIAGCVGCYLGDDGPSMHDCYIHRA